MSGSLQFEGSLLRRLEALSLASRFPLNGPTSGPRRSRRHGSSVEFTDFREYTPGDDFRRVDWKAYARLDRLFVRLYRAEEVTTVTLFLDRSASMRFGKPSKAEFAARLAALISYIAIHNYDMVAVAGWGDRLGSYHPPRGGVAAVPRIWAAIANVMASPEGPTDFTSLRAFRHLRRGSGISIILSDMLTDSDWKAGMRALRAAGQEVSLIQVLAPEEQNPTIRGDWKLHDVETSSDVEITLSPRLLKRYHEELESHTRAVSDYCRGHGVNFVQLNSAVSVADAIFGDLHTAGLVA